MINSDWRNNSVKILSGSGKYMMPELPGIGQDECGCVCPCAVEILPEMTSVHPAGLRCAILKLPKLFWSDCIAYLVIALSFLLTLLIVGGYCHLEMCLSGGLFTPAPGCPCSRRSSGQSHPRRHPCR